MLRKDQLLALFGALKRPKYRVEIGVQSGFADDLMTCYAAGLRISEACQLRVEDIDSKRMVLQVRYAKESKQRYTVLSERLLQVLRQYWLRDRPPEWLFPGQRKSGHVIAATVRDVFNRARDEVDLGKWCTPHTLRKVCSYYHSSLKMLYLKGNWGC